MSRIEKSQKVVQAVMEMATATEEAKVTVTAVATVTEVATATAVATVTVVSTLTAVEAVTEVVPDTAVATVMEVAPVTAVATVTETKTNPGKALPAAAATESPVQAPAMVKAAVDLAASTDAAMTAVSSPSAVAAMETRSVTTEGQRAGRPVSAARIIPASTVDEASAFATAAAETVMQPVTIASGSLNGGFQGYTRGDSTCGICDFGSGGNRRRGEKEAVGDTETFKMHSVPATTSRLPAKRKNAS